MPAPLPTLLERNAGLRASLYHRTVGMVVCACVAVFSLLHGHSASERGRAEGRREMAMACGLNRDTVKAVGLPPEINQALVQDQPFLQQMGEFKSLQAEAKAKEAAERAQRADSKAE